MDCNERGNVRGGTMDSQVLFSAVITTTAGMYLTCIDKKPSLGGNESEDDMILLST